MFKKLLNAMMLIGAGYMANDAYRIYKQNKARNGGSLFGTIKVDDLENESEFELEPGDEVECEDFFAESATE